MATAPDSRKGAGTVPPKNPTLAHVKFTRAKGKLYAYFRTGRFVNGKEVRNPLPEFGTAGFFEAYGAMLGAKTKRAKSIPTISSAADLYQRSDEWKALAPNSQRLYLIAMRKVVAEFGDFPLDDVKRKDILDVLDEIEGAASRNIFVAVLAVVFKFARYREMTTANPTKDIPKFKTGEHAPWPDDLLTAALAAEDDTVRLAVHLLYFTGQRIGDVCRMRWGDIAGQFIHVTQEKTGKALRIHQHKALQAELARTPKRGMTILAQPNGKPWTAKTILAKLQAFAKMQGAGRVVAHGLRKNAVIALLEASATIPEVQAVTGQSVDMVMHYAARINQGHMSEAAILKLERRRT